MRSSCPVPTKENLSDLMTKSLRAERVAYLLYHFGMVDTKTGNDLIGTDQVRAEDDRQDLRIHSCSPAGQQRPTADGKRVACVVIGCND